MSPLHGMFNLGFIFLTLRQTRTAHPGASHKSSTRHQSEPGYPTPGFLGRGFIGVFWVFGVPFWLGFFGFIGFLGFFGFFTIINAIEQQVELL